MLGTIRGRHLLTHGPLIVRLFGFRAYLRCVSCVLKSSRQGDATFLGALHGFTARLDGTRLAAHRSV